MEFSRLCDLCRKLEETRSRLAKTALTAEFLRCLSPGEVHSAVAFLTGRPLPVSDPRVLEVSWATLSGLLDMVGPAPTASSLTLQEAALSFAKVAEASGPGSRRTKVERLGKLFSRATTRPRDCIKVAMQAKPKPK